MKYHFHPSAKVELNEAIDYYERHQNGLGEEFAKEVYSAIHRVLKHLEAWPKLSENTRRCLTKRFPYSITPKNFVFLTIIFFKISRKAAKNAKKYIVLHFASFAALRENNIWLRLCCVRE